MNFQFYLILVNLTLSSHMGLVAATVHSAGEPFSVVPPKDAPFLKVALLKIKSLACFGVTSVWFVCGCY